MVIATAQNQISSNIFKTWMIMVIFSLFVFGVVYILLQAMKVDVLGVIGISLIAVGLANFYSYYFSDKIILMISQAKEVKKDEHPDLYRMVENLAIAAGLPTPKVYLINDTAPNAFATGRDPKHAAVAFTKGILQKLNKQELEGVVAHELSHIANRDTLLMTIVSVMVGFVALIADFFLRNFWLSGNRDDKSEGQSVFSGRIILLIAIIAAVLAPIIATLIQLAISRRREFLADASAAFLTRDPEQLASALIKISRDREPLEVANRATAHLYIVNPLKGQQVVGWFANLFNTHPPIEERVKALMAMEGRVV